jgi:AcrR family transcriptional regulator
LVLNGLDEESGMAHTEVRSDGSADIDLADAGDVELVRPLRADARRNRDALLVTAADIFATQGVDVSLEEIARRAGVGIGTLYRHFPTREALIADVYRREVEQLCGGVDDLLAAMTPAQALEEWMRRFVSYVATKRGMAAALKSVVAADSEIFTKSRAQINEAMARLVYGAAEAGTIRSDANPEDVLRAMSGFCLISDQPGWQEQALRLVSLLVDGLRYGASV